MNTSGLQLAINKNHKSLDKIADIVDSRAMEQILSYTIFALACMCMCMTMRIAVRARAVLRAT